jgi:hypothetical protein
MKYVNWLSGERHMTMIIPLALLSFKNTRNQPLFKVFQEALTVLNETVNILHYAQFSLKSENL